MRLRLLKKFQNPEGWREKGGGRRMEGEGGWEGMKRGRMERWRERERREMESVEGSTSTIPRFFVLSSSLPFPIPPLLPSHIPTLPLLPPLSLPSLYCTFHVLCTTGLHLHDAPVLRALVLHQLVVDCQITPLQQHTPRCLH